MKSKSTLSNKALAPEGSSSYIVCQSVTILMQKGQQKHYALLFPTFVRHTFMAFKTINNSVQVQKML
jgi:hypothetical protein